MGTIQFVVFSTFAILNLALLLHTFWRNLSAVSQNKDIEKQAFSKQQGTVLKEHFQKISIPISGIESLNVAAAGAIFMGKSSFHGQR